MESASLWRHALQAAGKAAGRVIGVARCGRAPGWLSWLPLVWGNYWVIDLDPAYTLAVVSEPKREYLWVLARQPHVDAATWDALMARLRAQGFELSKLLKVGGSSPL